jgi:RimJ/RimL family protein N-acetyltransferase
MKIGLEDTVLTSDRLVLRAFRTVTDAADLAAPITPAILRFLNWNNFGGAAGFEAVCADWAEKMRAGHAVVLTVRERGGGALVGMTGLHFIDRATPTVGLWIRDALQGSGYGSEVMRTLCTGRFAIAR